MTDRSKFEQMLEHLVNEESDKAKELFHQLVVEKSREIYENILADDFTTEEEMDDEDILVFADCGCHLVNNPTAINRLESYFKLCNNS